MELLRHGVGIAALEWNRTLLVYGYINTAVEPDPDCRYQVRLTGAAGMESNQEIEVRKRTAGSPVAPIRPTVVPIDHRVLPHRIPDQGRTIPGVTVRAVNERGVDHWRQSRLILPDSGWPTVKCGGLQYCSADNPAGANF